MKIAFDVDGTLFSLDGAPRKDVVDTLIMLRKAGHHIIVWSGGGKEYAESKVRFLKLGKDVNECLSKLSNDGTVDICFDDEGVKLATTNIKI